MNAVLALLFRSRAQRKTPAAAALRRALAACTDDEVFWLCEMNSYGPLYFLPTRHWAKALANTLSTLGVRRVLEVAAGDGFLTRLLASACPQIQFSASDNGAWVDANARMSPREQQTLKGVPGLALGSEVMKCSAKTAIRRTKPDLVLVSWAPPGSLVEDLIRARVPYVLDIATADASCGEGPVTWRFHHEVLASAGAYCRLDGRAQQHSRLALYYARGHAKFYEEG